MDRALAAAFLDGPWDRHAMVRRARISLRSAPADLDAVVSGVVAAHHRPPHDAPRALADLIAVLRARTRVAGHSGRPSVVRPALPVGRMGRVRWPVPEIATVGDLGDWLHVDAGTLAWLADVKGLERRAGDERLRHYRYAWITRSSGVPRVIEAPKGRLKAAQRQILREILVHIPIHDAAHGFRPSRSAITHAAAHTGQRIVLRLDLQDFFASVAAGRMFGILRHAGYPESVAHTLTALVTNAVPARWWATVPRPTQLPQITAHHHLGRRLAGAHLPQGAPTSPALANLCAFALDRRMSALAAASGARYTRYADDLVLSGGAELQRRSHTVCAAIAAITSDEGFRLQDRKTRMMSRAGRQEVCGIVVNDHPNVARAEVDRLKAILHALERDGHATSDRLGVVDLRTHLRGRIDWVTAVNPVKGARLRARHDAVSWA